MPVNISTRPNGTIRTQKTKDYEHTINGLISKRSFLVDDVKAAKAALGELEADIDAIDRSLKLLGLEDDPRRYMPSRKNRRFFKRGQMLQACFDVLREAKAPLTSREICLLILPESVEPQDKKAINQITTRILKALQKQAEYGRVKAIEPDEGVVMWEII